MPHRTPRRGPAVFEFRYPSVATRQKVAAKVWAFRLEPQGVGDDDVRGVVQIAHGMSEHARRYLPFARFLAEHGFVVVANDHLGHGETAADEDDFGFFGVQRSKTLLVEDMRTLFLKTRERYPDAPYFMLGHSMGSFLLREYLVTYGELSGAIIMGTGDPSPTTLSLGLGLTRLIETLTIKGERYRSPRLRKLVMGNYNARIKNPRTEFDWLSTDPIAVNAYEADRMTGFTFTTNGYEHMFSNLLFAVSNHAITRTPKELPLLVISGADDPVGGYGEQVRTFVRRLEAAGVHDVTLILYPGMRHEVLNEVERQQVYDDILAWLDAHL
ncbi:MAG: lysophospholipase [Coriobacteriia bacterium]|nr:lysophospholipase [Coriobacteriia bacterium]